MRIFTETRNFTEKLILRIENVLTKFIIIIRLRKSQTDFAKVLLVDIEQGKEESSIEKCQILVRVNAGAG